jgi:hypothetical protein
MVDGARGNDVRGSIGRSAFKTIPAALTAASANNASNPVWILPGTYDITSSLIIPAGVSVRGQSFQSTKIRLTTNVSGTVVTMGSGSTIDDLTLSVYGTGSSNGVYLKGVVADGTSAIRNCFVDVSAGASLTNPFTTGIEFSGTNSYADPTFSLNNVKTTSVRVRSLGNSNSRGILASGANRVSIHDSTVYVAPPANTGDVGSYVGVETTNESTLVQLRNTSVGVTLPGVGEAFTASDILQTNPTTPTYSSYLKSPGIHVGPGTDLVTRTAGGRGFTASSYGNSVYYGLHGAISNSPSNAFLWPGTQAIATSSTTFPDSNLAFYEVQQSTLFAGLSASLRKGASAGNATTLSVYYSPGDTIDNPLATWTGYISTTTVNGTPRSRMYINSSNGSLAVGQAVYGPGVLPGTITIPIKSDEQGTGFQLNVLPVQSVGSSGSPLTFMNGPPAAAFTGTVPNDGSKTITSITGSPNLLVGQTVYGYTTANNVYFNTGYVGIATPSRIVSISAGGVPTLDNVDSAGTSITFYTTNVFATGASVSLLDSNVPQRVYNVSKHLNPKDRVLVNMKYDVSGTNTSTDLAAQLNFF